MDYNVDMCIMFFSHLYGQKSRVLNPDESKIIIFHMFFLGTKISNVKKMEQFLHRLNSYYQQRQYELMISPKLDKKFRIITPSGKHVDFGAKGYEDFTIHKDEARKAKYIARHERREHWDDPNTAGFWSRWLLWNKLTINESITDIEQRFGISIKKELH